MKNSSLLVLAFLSLFYFESYAQQLSGDSWQKLKSTGSGEVTYTYNYSGKFMNKGPKGLEGLCYLIWADFLVYAESEHGVKINDKVHHPADPADFTAFYNLVKNGKNGVFGLADVTITTDRKKELEFSPSFFSNVSILLTNKSVGDLSSMSSIGKEFSGMTLVVQRGTTHETRAKELKSGAFPDLKIEVVNSFQECYQKVDKSADYFTYLDFSSYLTALENTSHIKRHTAGDQTGEEFGFIMPKGSDWKPIMDEFFNRNGGYTNSTEYKKIVANTLGNHVVSMLNSINK
ncbi:transporter substrate-binding domain-containing protein [Marivirga sp. S37H4]|uniref:Transporter substrate-binding domain-containing protein n=1 Tax=Marivirga aurantiaca TaxID=2802615 RepID=A0A935C9M3_9BACT|nr:transporter substrate-binding domain-containing protein [Marivirga aurantiaca]MBK6266125.1 transporter substrate-binding domain-containing protein [Marivirga aurantiaca]